MIALERPEIMIVYKSAGVPNNKKRLKDLSDRKVGWRRRNFEKKKKSKSKKEDEDRKMKATAVGLDVYIPVGHQ